jgi:hypothetical protein
MKSKNRGAEPKKKQARRDLHSRAADVATEIDRRLAKGESFERIKKDLRSRGLIK